MWAKFRGGRVTVIFDQIHEDDLEGAEGRAGGRHPGAASENF